MNVKWIEIWIIKYEFNFLLFLLYGSVDVETVQIA